MSSILYTLCTSSGCVAKDSLLLETANQAALEKIRNLEDGSRYSRALEEDVQVTSPPVFVTPLTGRTDLAEGASSHFECRIEPYPDPSMKVQWFFNGKPLNVGKSSCTDLRSFTNTEITSRSPGRGGNTAIAHQLMPRAGVCNAPLIKEENYQALEKRTGTSKRTFARARV